MELTDRRAPGKQRQSRVALYLWAQDPDRLALVDQFAELARFAVEQDWMILRVYEDTDWEAPVYLSERRAGTQLLSDASSGVFDMVLVTELDCLSTCSPVQDEIRTQLQTYGVQVLALREESPLEQQN